MGGRTKVDRTNDREMWIREVSDSRLQAYERLLDSSAAGVRVEGDRRSGDQQTYFRDLIQREKERRS